MNAEFKKTISIKKSLATRYMKYTSNNEWYCKLYKSYRIALDNVKNEFDLNIINEYNDIFTNAYKRNDIKVMKAVLENINFEYGKG
jgi:hypothetical protein